MTNKLSHATNSMNGSEDFIILLKSNTTLYPFIEKIKKFIANAQLKPTFHQQIDDLLENINLIRTQPFITLQLQRLLEAEKQNPNFVAHYDQFKEILEHHTITIPQSSKTCLDPQHKNNTYNSSIFNYQKWLFDQLFLLFCFNFQKVIITSSFIENYLEFIHQVSLAHVTTKVSLREQPMVNSTLLAEIPRNTVLKVYTNIINEYWLKVSFHCKDVEVEGYVQAIYLKEK